MALILIGGTLLFAAILGFTIWHHNRTLDNDCDDEAAMVENAEMQRTIITRGDNTTEI